jgi:hypothetical protein
VDRPVPKKKLEERKREFLPEKCSGVVFWQVLSKVKKTIPYDTAQHFLYW